MGRGSKSLDSVKSIRGREILYKDEIFAIYFMCLMAYLGMFRKSPKLSARNFDQKGVKTRRKRDRVKRHEGFWIYLEASVKK